MVKFNPEAMAERLARNVMDLNSDAITWDEFKRRNRAASELVARGELNIAVNDIERRHRQVQEHLDQILRNRSPLRVEASAVLRCAGK